MQIVQLIYNYFFEFIISLVSIKYKFEIIYYNNNFMKIILILKYRFKKILNVFLLIKKNSLIF